MKKPALIPGILVLVLLVMPGVLRAYSGGSGTSGDPYQIATWQDLVDLSTTTADWRQYFIQTADISASASHSEAFSPIGSATTKFTGSYDGGEFTIDSLYINQPVGNNIGLFGYTDGATIENLGLTNTDITGHQYVGGASVTIMIIQPWKIVTLQAVFSEMGVPVVSQGTSVVLQV